VVIQALREEDFEKIGDQVKEVTNDSFRHVAQKHKEMNKRMQA